MMQRFDPHDDSDNLVIAFNTVYDNGNHGERRAVHILFKVLRLIAKGEK